MTATPPGTERARRIRRVLWGILAANWVVAGAKLALGLASGSAALTADGLHSFVDGGSNVVGLVAMRIAALPPDANHPYGHEKFEALASLGIGAFQVLLDQQHFERAGLKQAQRLRPGAGRLELEVGLEQLGEQRALRRVTDHQQDAVSGRRFSHRRGALSQ